MGRSAGRGGSCPTSKVWVWSARRSSYESSNWRSYFAPLPGMGMKAVGRNPSASGAKDDSPPFQRWVGGVLKVESPRERHRILPWNLPRPSQNPARTEHRGLGFACISAWPGHPAATHFSFRGLPSRKFPCCNPLQCAGDWLEKPIIIEK